MNNDPKPDPNELSKAFSSSSATKPPPRSGDRPLESAREEGRNNTTSKVANPDSPLKVNLDRPEPKHLSVPERTKQEQEAGKKALERRQADKKRE